MPESSRHPRWFALRATVLAVSSALVGMPASAQNNSETPTETPSAQRLERIELSARPQTTTELRRQSTAAKQIYDEEEIQKFGDVSIGDAIKRLPGVSLSGGGPALRGLGSYTRILINGEPAPPNFDLNNLNPSQVKRIEVARAATADQTAEAIGGTINIILKEPPRSRTLEAQARVSYQYDNPAAGLNLSWGERIQGSTAFNLPFSYFEWNNFNAVRATTNVSNANGSVATGTRVSEQHPHGRGYNLTPTLNWKINEVASLNTQAFINQGRWNWSDITTDRRILSGQPVFADDSRNFGNWLNARLGTTYTNNFDGDQRLELKANVQYNANDFTARVFRGGAERRLTVAENRNPSVTQSGQYSRLVADSHTVTAGWNFEWRDWIGRSRTTELGVPLLPIYEGQDVEARVTRLSMFLQDEWEVNKRLSAYAGLRGERIETKTKTPGLASNPDPALVVTPMFHLKYKLDEKGQHLFRSSLTSTFKAPEPMQLLARPLVSGSYSDLSKPNDALSTDRIGNPALKPELATGFDVAYERYFTGGGVASATVFYRHVRDLIRNRTTLEPVSWASVPRYVSRPVNFDSADTFGLELEARGRAGTLLPFAFSAKTPLDLRASLNFYESKVKGVPGPDNRLDRQQPWSATLGLDYVLSGVIAAPIRLGGSVSFTPAYRTQQSSEQSIEFARTRTFDLYANVPLSPTMSVRLIANNLAPVASENTVAFGTQSSTNTVSKPRTWYGLILTVKG
ncbi:MAG: TonB-dependent receptor [Burkholderiales bacterium]|nr:MAG: TonB-dependent receptor [Betaproteobacteria bacterium]TAG24059.1 MAG: TonB-dependent receptor [Burkholderiales bacterium]